MNICYISFYTANTPYCQEAEMLSSTLRQFDLPHKIYEIPSRGSWLKNAMSKPDIILQAWHDFSCPLVFLDADARIVSKPTIFDNLDCDIGVHVRLRKGLSFFTSTMYWGRTKMAYDLIREWKDRCDRGETAIQRDLPPPYYNVNTTTWSVADQGPLVNAYLHFIDQGKHVNIFDLPKAYAVKQMSKHPEKIIIQTQASNIHKSKIK